MVSVMTAFVINISVDNFVHNLWVFFPYFFEIPFDFIEMHI